MVNIRSPEACRRSRQLSLCSADPGKAAQIGLGRWNPAIPACAIHSARWCRRVSSFSKRNDRVLFQEYLSALVAEPGGLARIRRGVVARQEQIRTREG